MTGPPHDACGWNSDLPTFTDSEPKAVGIKLEHFVRSPGPEQVRAWDDSIPWLQRECRELVAAYDAARAYTAILEYELPRESRRPDVIVLENGVVVVLELKGKAVPSQADVGPPAPRVHPLQPEQQVVLVPARLVDRVMISWPAPLRFTRDLSREASTR